MENSIYSSDELTHNYDLFISALQKTFTGERLEKMLHMYSMGELGETLMNAPASSNINFNNPYPGGYIDHVMAVVRASHKLSQMYISLGGIITYTTEELMFAGFNHDLGKLGYKGMPHYVYQESEWHRKNKGEYYVVNPDSQFMDLTDRAFFTLNQYGLQYNDNEFLGIKLASGLYSDDNVKYLKSFNPNRNHKIAIAHIIQMAKQMTTLVFRTK